MGWLVKALEVVALMFGTDVLWLLWGSWQKYKAKQFRAAVVGRLKKKRLPKFRQAMIPRRRG